METTPQFSPDPVKVRPESGSDSIAPSGAFGRSGAPSREPGHRGRGLGPPRYFWSTVRSRLDDLAIAIALRLGVTPRVAAGCLLVALVLVLALLFRWVGTAPAQAVTVPQRSSLPLVSGSAGPTAASANPAAAAPTGSPSSVASAGAGLAASGQPGGVGAPMSSPSGSGVTVHVAGQVRRPGVVDLAPGARVKDAISAAGGFTSAADQNTINLARPVVDGEQILVTKPGESAQTTPPMAAPGSSGGASIPASPVDLNSATVTELELLPGVGPVLAARIFQWRGEHGRFSTVDELGEVSGIGPATLERIRPMARV